MYMLLFLMTKLYTYIYTLPFYCIVCDLTPALPASTAASTGSIASTSSEVSYIHNY